MMTPGTPEKVKPVTSKGQDADSVWQCRPIWYQTPGMPGARCGSLASSGLPVVVSDPETTQEFDPTPSAPPPRRSGTPSTARRVAVTLRCPPGDVKAASRPA